MAFKRSSKLFYSLKEVSFGFRPYFRSISDSRFHLERIENRSVLRLIGKDVPQFLQGIITNDVNHFYEGSESIYSMILNAKGRVKFDVIIYRVSDDCFFMESDVEAIPKLERHLRMYRLKKDVTVSHEKNPILYQVMDLKEIVSALPQPLSDYFDKNYVGEETLDELKFSDRIISTRDPRLGALGLRLCCPEGQKPSKLDPLGKIDWNESSEPKYRLIRYMLGIAEGMNEIPYENSFPLEMNCDYLHGVSFHKGCYIGQELTARSYHTGVIRKRIMPLIFDSKDKVEIPCEIFIEGKENGKSVGKLRGVEGNYGIGLLRISESLKATALKVGAITARCIKPSWWPVEVPKEKQVNR